MGLVRFRVVFLSGVLLFLAGLGWVSANTLEDKMNARIKQEATEQVVEPVIAPAPVVHSAFALTVNPVPANAVVSIRNIGPKYYAEMKLKPGRYKVRVDAKGYQRDERWVTLESDLAVNVELEKQPERLPFEPEMVLIEGGNFMMGSPINEDGRKDDENQVPVQVGDFWIGKYEVTFSQWDNCLKDHGCKYNPSDDGDGRKNRPVINVSWHDVQQYIRWLNTKTGREYRLPTEAEWEYAARANTTTAYPWGNKINCKNASYWDISGNGKYCTGWSTGIVGSFPSNKWGIFDMVGNVWEWTCSVYEKPYRTQALRCGDSKNSRRVLRGGSYNSPWRYVRAANRSWKKASERHRARGFRLARAL